MADDLQDSVEPVNYKLVPLVAASFVVHAFRKTMFFVQNQDFKMPLERGKSQQMLSDFNEVLFSCSFTGLS